MQYTQLGKTGLVVSRLAFGAMTFGSDASGSAIYKVDQENAKQMIQACLDAGINFFDTADAYANGQSETILGQLLESERSNVVIATKVGFRTGEPITQAGLSRRHIFASCEQSLRRLKTDYIDLYIVHKEDSYTPIEETLEALNDLVRLGKVRYIGFSNWSAWKTATAVQLQQAKNWAPFCNGQMHYSLVGRDVEHEIAPLMQYSGIGMTVWSPLAGGFLSGKYTRENLKDSDNRLSGFDLLPFDKEHGFQVVETMREIAQPREASVAQVALAWLLAKPVVSCILIGASKKHQLEDNLKAIDLQLSSEEIATLDEMTLPTPIYPNWFIQNLADPKHKAALKLI